MKDMWFICKALRPHSGAKSAAPFGFDPAAGNQDDGLKALSQPRLGTREPNSCRRLQRGKTEPLALIGGDNETHAGRAQVAHRRTG